MEHVGKSITKDLTQPVRRQGKASEIVVIGPVGDIARTDGTESAGPVCGSLTKTVILIWGSSVQGERE